eukprot:TRINITY_DN1991_c1_g1_i1.p1 TRINITY_DN1991_c1_g1~~TRINITY_DN1991_c1_g1_i1.p1  ORF type:complete len:4365 (+),score=1563.77 TRINITY_DN1991_c1_g1_i1:29-13096(+)
MLQRALLMARLLLVAVTAQLTAAQDEVFAPLVTTSSGWSPPVRWRRIATVMNTTNDPKYFFETQTCAVRTSDCRRGQPSGQWWQPLVLTDRNRTESEPVPVLPLSVRVRYSTCSAELAPPLLNRTTTGTTAPFRGEVTVSYGAANSSFLAAGCYPYVKAHDAFGVQLDFRPRIGQGGGTAEHMGLMLSRGHPYASFTLQQQVLRVSFSSGVAQLGRLAVPAAGMSVRAHFVDVTDQSGSRWMMTLPEVHNVSCTQAGVVTVHGTVNGTVRFAHVPDAVHTGTTHSSGLAVAESAESHDALLTYSACVVTGGYISHNHSASVVHSDIAYSFTWRTSPSGCTPLVAALPHHLAAHGSAPAALASNGTAVLTYDTQYGQAVGVAAAQWDMVVPRRTANASEGAPITAQQREPLCVQAKLYDGLINDLERTNNTVRELDRAAVGTAVYQLATMVTAANRVGADRYYRGLITLAQTWVDQLLDAYVSYDDVWGMICDGALANTDGATIPRECWGEGHLAAYGPLLHGIARLWPHIIQEAEANRPRVQAKLEAIARTLVRDFANPSERDEYFPMTRGFDWYAGHVWDRSGIDPAAALRDAGNVGAAVTAYEAVAMVGSAGRMSQTNMTRTGELLLSLQTASWLWYRVPPSDRAADGALVTQWTANETGYSNNFTVLAPFGSQTLPLLQNSSNSSTAAPWLAALDETSLASMNYSQSSADVLLLAVANRTAAMPAFVNPQVPYTNTTIDVESGGMLWMIDREADLTSTVCPVNTPTRLAVRIVGPTIWYNDSFNYLFKVVDYQPTIIGRKLTSYNIYDTDLYGKIHRRDLRLIKNLGFNTVKISTAFFTIDNFIELCKDFDLNVIIAQILPDEGFSWGKYIAEDDFTKMLSFLHQHTNIVMWSIDSTALDSIQGRAVYDYYVLLNKLRLLRNAYDNQTRPIVVPFTEYTLANMTQDKVLYNRAVEIAEIRTDMPLMGRIRKTIEPLGHPVMLAFFADSWHFVNQSKDEEYQAAFLGNTIRNLLPLHEEQELAGLQVTEWSDQHWRGSQSDPDNDCPDPSAYRHSTCGYRRIEMYDGALTLEHMGINEQYQVFFKHCIRHKLSYYAVGSALGGSQGGINDPTDPRDDCIFLGLTDEALWTIVVFLSMVALCACGSAVHNCCTSTRRNDDPEHKQQWRQPNTEKIEEVIYRNTAALLDHPVFASLNVFPELDEDQLESSTQSFSQRWRSGAGRSMSRRQSMTMGAEGSPEVDPKSWNRWQVIQMQKDHLTKLLFDEMMCQMRYGKWKHVGEHNIGFELAVSNLHKRYFNSYLGWLRVQEDYGATGSAGQEWVWVMNTRDDFSYVGPLPKSAVLTIEDQRALGKTEFSVRIRGRDFSVSFQPRPGEQDHQATRGYLIDMQDMFDAEDQDLEPVVMGTVELQYHPGGLASSWQLQLVDLLVLLSMWHLGEQMTWCCGHWLHWCFHYFQLHRRFPETTIMNDARHFQTRAVSFDDISESCVMRSYFDVKDTTGVDGQSGVNPETEEERRLLGQWEQERRMAMDAARKDTEDAHEAAALQRRQEREAAELYPDRLLEIQAAHAVAEACEEEEALRLDIAQQQADEMTNLEHDILEEQRRFTRTSVHALYDKETGNYNQAEIDRFPFQRTFREPLKAGVIMAMIHNTYYIVHTQFISFVFWAFLVSVSAKNEKLLDVGISGMFDRIYDVFANNQDDLFSVFLICSKVDFWLVVVNEVIDLWMVGGLYHFSSQDWSTTFLRVSLHDYIKLRWSAFTSIVAFALLIAFPDITGSVTGASIAVYVTIRWVGIIASNAIIIFFPVKLKGAPLRGPQFAGTRNVADLAGSMLFWFLLYCSVQLFQAWVMFRTQTIDWTFCECENNHGDVLEGGLVNFLSTTFGQMFSCFDEQPKCASAVLLIWINAVLVFIVVVNAAFIVWTMLFGTYQHIIRQWKSRKSRSLIGKKVQTAYIFRTLNIKMLGFTDPRDMDMARKVWNRVIFEMWRENILSAFEYQNLIVHKNVGEIQFNIKNYFAIERLSNFLEYIHAVDGEELGPPSTYPSMSIVIPVFNEDIMCAGANTAGGFNERIRDPLQQQELTQLHFLIECYPDEWVNFVEQAVLGDRAETGAEQEPMFREVLDEDWVDQFMDDAYFRRKERDPKRKREMKGDSTLRKEAAHLIADLIHTQPHLFYEEEMEAVQWWASMRMQTVARTVRGMERKREALSFMLWLEREYTGTENMSEEFCEVLANDKIQIILALQNLANNRWYTKQESALMTMWSRYPKVQVSFPIDTQEYRNSPTVVRKVREHVFEQWECERHLSCLATWVPLQYDEEEGTTFGGTWVVTRTYARRNPLRLEKKSKFGINGLQQGKAANQAHSIPFATGQLIQAIDCNQDGYFEEALKLRSVLTKFWPGPDRSTSEYKIVGFPEYSTTSRSGIVGRISSYSEYIFVNVAQKVMAHPLGVRMHYGHPDFFDKSWITTQGGMSKANPKINLNEDIFAGYHVSGSGEAVDHVDSVREGKGRETNFDGANGFQMKLAYGASMQFRTRDQFELMRTSDVMRRHSIFFGSVGSYIYLITIVFLIFSTMLTNICLSFASKSDYELTSRGSPYGTEWMIQMSLVETIPLLVQLVLDFGVWGLLEWAWHVLPMTLFFLFVIMTKFNHFVHSALSGSASYVATGRTDPLFRRSLRHMFRMYGHTHFMPGMLLFMLVWLYMDIETRAPGSALLRTLFHWGVGLGWIVTPCVFNPSLDFKGLVADLTRFYVWVFADKIPRLQDTDAKDLVTKHRRGKDASVWDKAYDAMKKQADRQLRRDRRDQRETGSDTDSDAQGRGRLRPADLRGDPEIERMLADFGEELDDATDVEDRLWPQDDDLEPEMLEIDDLGAHGMYEERHMPMLSRAELEERKQAAVERGDFAEAIKMRDQIRLMDNEEKLQVAVAEERWEAATEIKAEIVRLRASLEEGAAAAAPAPDPAGDMEPTSVQPTARERVSSAKESAVAREDWSEANRLALQLKEIDLEEAKQQAVDEGDFTRAHHVKQELQAVRAKLAGLQTPTSSPPLTAGSSMRAPTRAPPLPPGRPAAEVFEPTPMFESGGVDVSPAPDQSPFGSINPLQSLRSVRSPRDHLPPAHDEGGDDDETVSGWGMSGSMLTGLDQSTGGGGPQRPPAVPRLEALPRAEQHRPSAAGALTRRDMQDAAAVATARRREAQAVTLKQAEEEPGDDDTENKFDFDWLRSFTQLEDAKFDKYLEVFRSNRICPAAFGTDTTANTHLDRPGGSVPTKVIGFDAIVNGYKVLGKTGTAVGTEVKEFFGGLGQVDDFDIRADFVQFLVVFHKVEGVSDQDHLTLDAAHRDIKDTRGRELQQVARDVWRKKRRRPGRSKVGREALLTILHGLRREVRVGYRDSTSDTNKVKAQSLKHLWKVEQILGKRGSSTAGMFCFSLFFLSLWAFCYCSLWQDTLWDVFYLVVAITWDYVLCLSQMRTVTLVTRVAVSAFILFRIVKMVALTNVLFPTLCLTYWLIHAVLEVELTFWSAFGPFFLLRKLRKNEWSSLREIREMENALFPGFATRPLDEQREACLIQLLKDDREQFLWGWPYYLVARQILACIIGLLQFLFALLVLLFRTLVYLFQWLIYQIDMWQRRKHPTQLTYLSDKRALKEYADAGDFTGPLVDRWVNTAMPDVAHKLCQVGVSAADVERGYDPDPWGVNVFSLTEPGGPINMGPSGPHAFGDLPDLPPLPGGFAPQGFGGLPDLPDLPPLDDGPGEPPAAPGFGLGRQADRSPAAPPREAPTWGTAVPASARGPGAEAESPSSAAGQKVFVGAPVRASGAAATRKDVAGKPGRVTRVDPKTVTVRYDDPGGKERDVVLPRGSVTPVAPDDRDFVPRYSPQVDAPLDPPSSIHGPLDPRAGGLMSPSGLSRIGSLGKPVGPEALRMGVQGSVGRVVAADKDRLTLRFDDGREMRLPASEVTPLDSPAASALQWSDMSPSAGPSVVSHVPRTAPGPAAAADGQGLAPDTPLEYSQSSAGPSPDSRQSQRPPLQPTPAFGLDSGRRAGEKGSLPFRVGDDIAVAGGPSAISRGVGIGQQGKVLAVAGSNMFLRFHDGSEAILPADELQPKEPVVDDRRRSSTALSEWGNLQAPGAGQPRQDAAGPDEAAARTGGDGRFKHIMFCIDPQAPRYPGWTPLKLLAKTWTDSPDPPTTRDLAPWEGVGGYVAGEDVVHGGEDFRPVTVAYVDGDGRLTTGKDEGFFGDVGPPTDTVILEPEDDGNVHFMEEGTNRKFFVPKRAFDNIGDLRSAIRVALRFRGPLQQVQLLLRDHGRDVELLDNDPWPVHTTHTWPLIVRLSDVYVRERKTRIAERKGDLRGMTALEQRATQ